MIHLPERFLITSFLGWFAFAVAKAIGPDRRGGTVLMSGWREVSTSWRWSGTSFTRLYDALSSSKELCLRFKPFTPDRGELCRPQPFGKDAFSVEGSIQPHVIGAKQSNATRASEGRTVAQRPCILHTSHASTQLQPKNRVLDRPRLKCGANAC